MFSAFDENLFLLSPQIKMEYINEPSTFHEVYYPDLTQLIKSHADKQISSIPQDVFDTCPSYRQFLNQIIDPLILMTDSFHILQSIDPEFITSVWNDISDKPFQFVLDYIFHVNTIETSPFQNCYRQLIKQYNIQTITAARVVNDCFIHYLKDVYITRHHG